MSSLKVNKHSILIKAGFQPALLEIIRWGESPWWPANSLMRFNRQDKSPVQKGTRYRQLVLFPFAPSWDVEVTSITGSSITRRFLNGMFYGEETVSLRIEKDGVIVDYVMNCAVRGFSNKILWALIFRRLHDSNIEAILAHLKNFLEKRET